MRTPEQRQAHAAYVREWRRENRERLKARHTFLNSPQVLVDKQEVRDSRVVPSAVRSKYHCIPVASLEIPQYIAPKLRQDKEFLLDGADLHNFLSMPPDGCFRKLLYLQAQPAPQHKLYMKKIAFEIYSKTYRSATLKSWSPAVLRHPEHRWMIAKPDGFIVVPRGRDLFYSAPLLEIEICTMAEYFSIKHRGLTESLTLRAVHQNLTREAPYCSVCCFSPELMEITVYDVGRDEDREAQLVSAEKQIIDKTLAGTPPAARHKPDSMRCLACDFREVCHRIPYGSNDELNEISYAYVQLRNLMQHCETHLISLNDRIVSLIEEGQEVLTSRFSILLLEDGQLVMKPREGK